MASRKLSPGGNGTTQSAGTRARLARARTGGGDGAGGGFFRRRLRPIQRLTLEELHDLLTAQRLVLQQRLRQLIQWRRQFFRLVLSGLVDQLVLNQSRRSLCEQNCP